MTNHRTRRSSADHRLRGGLKKGLAAMSVAATLSLAIAAGFASAQETDAAAPEEARKLDIVTVIARKKEETALDVPLSVSAVSGETLQKFGVQDFESIDLPGVRVERGGMADSPSIRGISSGNNLGFEQSAPLYIDGVYFGRGRLTRFAFSDLEAIEVLKGPQPVYYGKNAIAGAIGLRTNNPTETFEYGANGYYEFNDNEVALDGYVSGPLAEGVRARLSAKSRTMDGYLTNVVTGVDEPNVQDLVVRGKLELDLSDSINLLISAFGGGNEDDGRNNQLIRCSAAFFTEFGDPAVDECIFDDRKSNFADLASGASPEITPLGASKSFFNKLDFSGGSATANWNVNDAVSVAAITAYYEFTNGLTADPDNSSRNVLLAAFNEDFSQFSQEIRANGEHDRWNWTAGFYYDENSNNLDNIAVRNFGAAKPGGMLIGMAMASGDIVTRNREDADSWAVFGEIGVDVTPSVTLSAGGRYDEVTKSNTITQCNAALFQTNCTPTAASTLSDELNFTSFQPSLTAEWRPLDDIMTFVSWREGFKAGGFDFAVVPSAANADAFTFDPEEAETLEFGVKGTSFNGNLAFSGVLFETTIKNLQQTGLNPDPAVLAVETFNTGELRSRGAELEATARLSDFLTGSASVVFLDNEYTEFRGAECYALQTALQGCTPDPVTGLPVQDLTGSTSTFAPDYSGTFGLSYDRPVSSRLRLFADAQAFITDDYLTEVDNDPNTVQEGYTKVDLSIGLGEINDRWSIALIGRNLTDELTAGAIIDSPGAPGTYSAFTERPRTVGMQLRIKN